VRALSSFARWPVNERGGLRSGFVKPHGVDQRLLQHGVVHGGRNVEAGCSAGAGIPTADILALTDYISFLLIRKRCNVGVLRDEVQEQPMLPWFIYAYTINVPSGSRCTEDNRGIWAPFND
jgi:hypothetical protein